MHSPIQEISGKFLNKTLFKYIQFRDQINKSRSYSNVNIKLYNLPSCEDDLLDQPNYTLEVIHQPFSNYFVLYVSVLLSFAPGYASFPLVGLSSLLLLFLLNYSMQ